METREANTKEDKASLDSGASRKSDYESFMKALRDDDFKAAESIVNQAGNVDLLEVDKKEPLIFAIHHRNLAFIDLVLRAGGNMEYTDSKGEAALIRAVYWNDESLIRILIRKGADVNCAGSDKITPLMKAAMQGRTRLMKLLILAGADIEAKGPEGKTALLLSIGRGTTATNMLKNYGANLRVVDDNGMTGFMTACKHRREGPAVMFLKYGAKVNAVNKHGETALALALNDLCGLSFVQFLTRHGACANALGEDCKAFLLAKAQLCVNEGQRPVKHGSCPDIKVKDTAIPLMMALRHKCYRQGDAAKLLLEKGACVNIADMDGQTPLMIALHGSSREVVKLLIDHEANVNARDIDGRTPLMICLQKSYRIDTDQLKLLLEHGACVNVQDKSGKTPLLLSTDKHDHFNAAKLLLEHGADINSADLNGKTPLMATNSDEVIKLFLERGACVNAVDMSGQTPLILALKEGNRPAAEQFINHGACVNATTNGGTTPLMLALQIEFSNEEIVKLLLKNGACVKTADLKAQSLLRDAIMDSSEEVVELLIASDARVDTKHNDGTTPLLAALEKRYDDNFIKTLIEKGACVHTADSNGQTPLLNALKYTYNSQSSSRVVKLLLKNGACVNTANRFGRTPLMEALNITDKLQTAMAKCLVLHGAKVDVMDNEGRTPLLIALQNSLDQETIKLLLDHHACVNTADRKGQSPLMIALDYCSSQVAKLIIEQGARVNMRFYNGTTALTLALRKRHDKEVVKALIDHGACVNEKKNYGTTPLLYCLRSSHTYQDQNFVTEMVELLLEKGASVNIEDNKRNTPIIEAVKWAKYREVKTLLRYGACVNSVDARGQTPLMAAVERCCGELVALLIQHGACVDVVDNDGKTPLMLAAENGHSNIIYQIVKAGAKNINFTDSKGYTALMILILKSSQTSGSASSLELLIKSGAKINTIAKDGSTPLILATKIKRMENECETLDQRDSIGYTALMHLLDNRFLDTGIRIAIFKLVELGACVNTGDRFARTPLALALQRFDAEFEDRLRGYHTSRPILMKLLDHAADMSTSLSIQEYLQKMVYYRENTIVQKMIMNGCPPLSFPLRTRRLHSINAKLSPLQVALLSDNMDAFIYFLANHFFLPDDVSQFYTGFYNTFEYSLHHPLSFQQREKKAAKAKEHIQSILELPISLFAASFVAVSSALAVQTESPQHSGLSPPTKLSRKEKVDRLPLPVSLKKALLFQTPTAFIDPTLWREIGCSSKNNESDHGDDFTASGGEAVASHDGYDDYHDGFDRSILLDHYADLHLHGDYLGNRDYYHDDYY